MTSNNYWKVIPQFAPLNGLHADICILYRCSTNRAPLHFLHILDKHLESGNTLKNSLKSFFWNVDSDVLQILHLILNERSLGKETPAILIFSLYAEGEKKGNFCKCKKTRFSQWLHWYQQNLQTLTNLLAPAWCFVQCASVLRDVDFNFVL